MGDIANNTSDNGYKKFGTYYQNGESYGFRFNTSLSAGDKISFVNNLTFLLVGDYYNYIVKDLLFNFFIIKDFTDVSVSNIVNSDSMIDDAEMLIKNTNIVDIVVENAEYGLIDELRQAVDLNVEYKTGIHRNVISESIVDLIKTLEHKIGNFTIDPDSLTDMMNLFNGISDEFTMGNLLDAYSKSNMYKENHKLIEE